MNNFDVRQGPGFALNAIRAREHTNLDGLSGNGLGGLVNAFIFRHSDCTGEANRGYQ
jgi:hypothetical protein